MYRSYSSVCLRILNLKRCKSDSAAFVLTRSSLVARQRPTVVYIKTFVVWVRSLELEWGMPGTSFFPYVVSAIHLDTIAEDRTTRIFVY